MRLQVRGCVGSAGLGCSLTDTVAVFSSLDLCWCLQATRWLSLANQHCATIEARFRLKIQELVMTGGMFCRRQAFQIFNVIVRLIVVPVMDVVSCRDRATMFDPNDVVKPFSVAVGAVRSPIVAVCIQRVFVAPIFDVRLIFLRPQQPLTTAEHLKDRLTSFTESLRDQGQAIARIIQDVHRAGLNVAAGSRHA